MELNLNSRVALITGSGRGIGKAAALALGREGACIVITDIDAAAVEQACAELRAQGCEAIAMGCSGKGMLAGLVLGSVARKVIHLATLPVTLVK